MSVLNARVPNERRIKMFCFFFFGKCVFKLVRKLCNTSIQEFLSVYKQETATKKGLASTVDLNLTIML